MNQNPQSNYKTRRAEKHAAQAVQRTSARLAAAAMLNVAVSGPGHIGDYPDTNWHLRKQRPTQFSSNKSEPRFSNEVNADTHGVIPDVTTPAPGAVPAAVPPSPEQGPVDVPKPILLIAQ